MTKTKIVSFSNEISALEKAREAIKSVIKKIKLLDEPEDYEELILAKKQISSVDQSINTILEIITLNDHCEIKITNEEHI